MKRQLLRDASAFYLLSICSIISYLYLPGTHYQFLWYVVKVFLPGRRQLCRLSALIQPSSYADILTQKVLIVSMNTITIINISVHASTFSSLNAYAHSFTFILVSNAILFVVCI